MEAQLRRSGEELTGLGREVEGLRERCGRLSQGRSLAMLATRKRADAGENEDSSEDEP